MKDVSFFTSKNKKKLTIEPSRGRRRFRSIVSRPKMWRIQFQLLLRTEELGVSLDLLEFRPRYDLRPLSIGFYRLFTVINYYKTIQIRIVVGLQNTQMPKICAYGIILKRKRRKIKNLIFTCLLLCTDSLKDALLKKLVFTLSFLNYFFNAFTMPNQSKSSLKHYLSLSL